MKANVLPVAGGYRAIVRCNGLVTVTGVTVHANRNRAYLAASGLLRITEPVIRVSRLESIVRDVARRAAAGGLSVDRDCLGVAINFPKSAWYGNPEDDGVYLQEHHANGFEATLKEMTEKLPDVEFDVLELYSASREIDFC